MSGIGASVSTRYLSAGANRYAAAADWGDDGLVAFGADINVCLWNPAVSRENLYPPRIYALMVLTLATELQRNITNTQWTHCSCEGCQVSPNNPIPTIPNCTLAVWR